MELEKEADEADEVEVEADAEEVRPELLLLLQPLLADDAEAVAEEWEEVMASLRGSNSWR